MALAAGLAGRAMKAARALHEDTLVRHRRVLGTRTGAHTDTQQTRSDLADARRGRTVGYFADGLRVCADALLLRPAALTTAGSS